RLEYNQAIETEKPDVLFLIARYLDANAPISGTIHEDLLYKTMSDRIAYFESKVKIKVILLQAFPLAARLVDLEKKRTAHGLPMLP
ncbi:hypothetical protein PFISCL1PPCAC_22218, partial [Pristionchus fissidentatus]